MSDVTLVCGSGGALGGALVEALQARGDEVVGVDRVDLDLSSAQEVEALWERLEAEGRTPRFVVNAVGAFRGGSVADSDPDSFRLMSAVNLETAWWTCRAAARRLAEGGAIVNVSSRSGVSGGAGSAAYSVAKAGVIRLTEVLAAELAPRRVRVNAILPSVIDTPANQASMPAGALDNAVAPAEIAAVVAFLLSDAAAAVSGAILPVYGWA